MKKVLKVIGIILLVIAAGAVFLLFKMSDQKNHCYKYTETGGKIEASYTALGSYAVSSKEYEAKTAEYVKYTVWYPTDIDSQETWPAVVIANGTGAAAASYKEVYEHLAS